MLLGQEQPEASSSIPRSANTPAQEPPTEILTEKVDADASSSDDYVPPARAQHLTLRLADLPYAFEIRNEDSSINILIGTFEFFVSFPGLRRGIVHVSALEAADDMENAMEIMHLPTQALKSVRPRDGSEEVRLCLLGRNNPLLSLHISWY
jgi:hypothetical protein